MKLELNGLLCEMPPEVQAQLLGYVWQDMERRYGEIDGAMKAGMKLAARKILLSMERKARKQVGEEAAMRIRPPKGTDPNLHLGRLMFGIGNEALKDVTVAISLKELDSGEYIVSGVSIEPNQDQARRSLACAGDDRERKDYVLEAPGNTTVEVVPASEILHF